MIVPVYSAGPMIVELQQRLVNVVDELRLWHRRGIVDRQDRAVGEVSDCTDRWGLVAIRERPNSRSSRSRTISMCSNPRKPASESRNPAPALVSGS